MRGRRVSPPGPPGPVDDTEATQQRTAPGPRIDSRTVKTALLWLMMLACVAWVVVVAVGFLQLDHDLEHPSPENGLSDWQCSGQTRTCRP